MGATQVGERGILAKSLVVPTALSVPPTAWYKADAITGLTDGAQVPSWVDSSGNGHTMSQGTSSQQPLYVTGIRSGLPVVRFDGVNDCLTGTELTLNPSGSLFIAQNTSGDGCLVGSTSTNNQWRIGEGGGNFISTWDGAHSTQGSTLRATRPYWFVAEYVWGGGGTIQLFENGVAQGTGLYFGTGSGHLGAIGALQAPAALFLTGDIGEILVYNTNLSSTDRASVETYIISKWKL